MRLETGKKSALCFMSTAPYLHFQCSQSWHRVTWGRAVWKNFQVKGFLPWVILSQKDHTLGISVLPLLSPLVSFLCPVLLEDPYIPFKNPTQHFLCKFP